MSLIEPPQSLMNDIDESGLVSCPASEPVPDNPDLVAEADTEEVPRHGQELARSPRLFLRGS